ncbi:MAG: hypothetical protein HPY45_11280 [Anaerolineae bacterium]|nr:hypothetical protein [Anaerolineae bacterium]
MSKVRAQWGGVVIFWLAPLMIVFVAVWRALPYLSMPPEARLLAASQPGGWANLAVWAVVILVNLLAAWLIWQKYGLICPSGVYWRYLLALAVGCGLLVGVVVREIGPGKPGAWNVFYLAPDSASYIQPYSAHTSRPPVYPLFIDIVAGRGFDHTFDDSLVNKPLMIVDHPLLRVVRLQKALLVAAILLACYALMRFLVTPLPAVLFLLLQDFNFFGTEVDYVLSDTLAMVFLLLILAVFLEMVREASFVKGEVSPEGKKPFSPSLAHPWKQLRFPVIGVLCALLYLTRPAGVYGVALLGMGALWLLITGWRINWRNVLLGLALAAGLVSVPPLYVYFETGNLSPAPLYAVSRAAFALQVAQPSDVSLMPDVRSREFLERALERKKTTDAEIRQQYQNDPVWVHWYSILSNSHTAMITLRDMQPPATGIEGTKILQNASAILLRQHFLDYLRLSWYSFQIETGVLNRLDPFLRHFGIPTFWYAVGLFLALALWLRGKEGFVVVSFFLTHFTNLVIVALFDLPTQRYSGATEHLLLLAVLVLAAEASRRFIRKPVS